MKIPKEDAIAYLAKWYDAGAEVKAVYRTSATRLQLIGIVEELSPTAIKVVAPQAEIVVYFEDTSSYEYQDGRATDIHGAVGVDKYPIFIEVMVNTAERLEVSEYL